MSATANLQVIFSAPVAQDLNTHWLAQTPSPSSPGTLAAAMAATDTTFTLTPSTVQGAPQITLGSGLLIDQEVLKVTAQAGEVFTVTRAQVTPLVGSPSAHAQGAAITLLTFPDPWTMIAGQALRPYAQQVTLGLGAQSATFTAQATGSITVGP